MYTFNAKYGPNHDNLGELGALVYMYFEVGGALIPDDSRVLVWAEIDNPDPEEVGNYEAFECVAIYKQSQEFTPIDSVSVRSFEGTYENGWPRLDESNDVW